MKSKKAVSPVIATAFLIALTIVLAVIVFIWAREWVKEGIQRDGEPIERACERVNFEAGIARNANENYFLEVNNRGNIPIYGFDIRKLEEGKASVYSILDKNVDAGNSAKIELSGVEIEISPGDEFFVMPVITGTRGNAQESYSCGDKSGESVIAE